MKKLFAFCAVALFFLAACQRNDAQFEKLMKLNDATIEKINAAKTPEDVQQITLKWGEECMAIGQENPNHKFTEEQTRLIMESSQKVTEAIQNCPAMNQ